MGIVTTKVYIIFDGKLIDIVEITADIDKWGWDSELRAAYSHMWLTYSTDFRLFTEKNKSHMYQWIKA